MADHWFPRKKACHLQALRLQLRRGCGEPQQKWDWWLTPLEPSTQRFCFWSLMNIENYWRLLRIIYDYWGFFLLRLYTFLHIKVWGSQWLQHLFCSLDVGFEEVDAQRILPAKDLQNPAESSLCTSEIWTSPQPISLSIIRNTYYNIYTTDYI